jgi:S-adenosyl-L-methionine hydrolase (adenosine-forming)
MMKSKDEEQMTKDESKFITLLTDFGTRDYFVGAMKGVILSFSAQANIIDITHEIPPQDVRSAAFTLAAYYKNFPPGTIHLAVVDPGVGSARRAILLVTQDYFFLAPDNGLLSFIFEQAGSPTVKEGLNAGASSTETEKPALTPGLPTSSFRVFELTGEKYFAKNVSRTFHGRDVFAPVAAHLSNGVEPQEFGAEIKDFVRFEIAKPKRISQSEIEAEIIHLDRFGNLVTNLKAVDLPAKFVLEINRIRIEKPQRFYAEAEKGEIFSIIGSEGFVEISAFQDSAERLLKARVGQKILLSVTNE